MPVFEIISLKEWWKGDEESNKDAAAIRRLPLIDIRESQDNGPRLRYNNNNNNNANDGSCSSILTTVVVQLPLSELQSGERSCELPPRHVPFAILANKHQLEAARDFFGAIKSRVTGTSRTPWLVKQVLLVDNTDDGNDCFWRDANELGLLQQDNQDILPNNNNNAFHPLPRLWQPDPMIQYVLWPLLKERCLSRFSIHPNPAQEEEVWDLGCGSGRDVCFLAEQSKALGIDHSYRFVGIDHHKASAKRCLPFWLHRNVGDRTQVRNVDLRKMDRVQNEMRMARSNVVCLYAVRFWNAKLIQCIANTTLLGKGTLFAMSHFCKPYPCAPWNFDHPKVRLYIIDKTSVIFRNSLHKHISNQNRMMNHGVF